MRLGVLAGFAWLSWCSLGACSGGYPLPPTDCDVYCDVTKGTSCPTYYDPAGCVASCEDNHYPRCKPQLDAVVDCYRQNPDELTKLCNYVYGEMFACGFAQAALSDCSGIYR